MVRTSRIHPDGGDPEVIKQLLRGGHGNFYGAKGASGVVPEVIYCCLMFMKTVFIYYLHI